MDAYEKLQLDIMNLFERTLNNCRFYKEGGRHCPVAK